MKKQEEHREHRELKKGTACPWGLPNHGLYSHHRAASYVFRGHRVVHLQPGVNRLATTAMWPKGNTAALDDRTDAQTKDDAHPWCSSFSSYRDHSVFSALPAIRVFVCFGQKQVFPSVPSTKVALIHDRLNRSPSPFSRSGHRPWYRLLFSPPRNRNQRSISPWRSPSLFLALCPLCSVRSVAMAPQAGVASTHQRGN